MFFRELFGLFMIVVAIEAVNKILEKNVYRFKPTVCRTDDCKTMANVILSAMNRTADPCENFYEYACGTWINSNETLPADQVTWSRFEMFNRELMKKLRGILESKSINDIPVEMAKRWYRACMDEESLENRGMQPLTSITNAVGGWPITMALGEWNPSDYSWQAIERYYSRMTASYAMYDLAITTKPNNASDIKISLNAATLPLSKILQYPRNYLDSNDKKPYADLIAGVAKSFAIAQGMRVSDEKIAKEVRDMVEFEYKLHGLTEWKMSIPVTISEAQRLVNGEIPVTEKSRINILGLIENLIEGIGEIEITEEEEITIDIVHFTALKAVLNETSFRTIVNYVHWHYLSRILYTTNSQMRELLLEFKKKTLGVSKAMPRWEHCVSNVKLNHALSYQFVLKHFTQNISSSASEMVRKIQTELEKQINGSNWMDVEMKNLWIEKLWNVKVLLGFPNWYKNVTNLEKYYEGLNIDNDYFNNVINYMRFERKKMFKNLRAVDDQPEWFADPITINAFYMPFANSMNIPAADFQPPLFTSMMPNAIKYGIIGSIFGHELSHAFGPVGFLYDKNGAPTLYSETTLEAYGRRMLCFLQQYEKLSNDSAMDNFFYADSICEENYADATGLQSAFDAYKSVVRESVKGDRKLIGLEDFSNDQLFLLSYATVWCEISTPQYDRKQLVYGDHHGASRTRILATLSNLEGFAEAFNCPLGSPMNPQKKCNLWTGLPVEIPSKGKINNI